MAAITCIGKRDVINVYLTHFQSKSQVFYSAIVTDFLILAQEAVSIFQRTIFIVCYLGINLLKLPNVDSNSFENFAAFMKDLSLFYQKIFG